MTILFLTRLYRPHIGGVEKHVEKIASELIKQNHRINIITEQYDRKLKQAENYKSIKIYRIPVWDASEKSKKWHIWHWLWQHRQLIHQADIIHIHDIFFWYLPFRFLFPLKRAFITFHGYETKFPPSKSAIIQRQMATKLTYGSIAVGDYINKWYMTRINLITYGATDQKPLPLPQKPHILILGRLSYDNDINKVIQALKTIKNTPITFLGDGELRPQAEAIGQVTGFIQNTTSYLRRASLVIASSYLSILDALAAGRPVISIYSNPLKKDYLKPLSQYIYLAPSVKQLTRLISSRLAPGVGASWARQQTWDKITQQYLNLWQKN